ncbi:MAG: CapA family protein, partial [Cutibacterium granulosum]|nr:CapA family protein [Cutibacterium granulosum]
MPHSTRSGSLTLTVSGDLLWHNSTWRTARSDGHGSYDFAPIFG